MEIKERKGYFFIKDSQANIALVFSKEAKIKDEVNIIINSNEPESENVFAINKPGEFEVKDVFIMVLEKNGENSYIVEVDDISMLLISHNIVLTEQDLEMIGTVDILLFKEDYELNMDVVKLVNKLDPKLLLLQSKPQNKEDVKKYFGVELREEAKKLKFSSTEFEADEYKLDIIQIGAE
jgi:hypothetical protein